MDSCLFHKVIIIRHENERLGDLMQFVQQRVSKADAGSNGFAASGNACALGFVFGNIAWLAARTWLRNIFRSLLLSSRGTHPLEQSHAATQRQGRVLLP